MYLHIAPNRLIKEVQKEFNTEFPYLKFEFFRNKPSGQPGLPLKNLILHNCRIGEMQAAITDGDVEIKEDMKVEDLENIFKDKFGLSMQIFRRSGNIWLETTMTDNWTLGRQNEHGKEISAEGIINEPAQSEYDLSGDEGH